MRASDSDREHVADRLRTAVTEGRLSHEEFEERLHDALSARTYGQLDPLLADLPAATSTSATVAYAGTTPKTNGLAIASLVLGVAGFLFLWGIGPLGALVSGVMAKREIRLSNGTQGGGGLASAGIVLGALGLLLAIVAIVAMTGGLLVGHHLVFGDSR